MAKCHTAPSFPRKVSNLRCLFSHHSSRGHHTVLVVSISSCGHGMMLITTAHLVCSASHRAVQTAITEHAVPSHGIEYRWSQHQRRPRRQKALRAVVLRSPTQVCLHAQEDCKLPHLLVCTACSAMNLCLHDGTKSAELIDFGCQMCSTGLQTYYAHVLCHILLVCPRRCGGLECYILQSTAQIV